MYKDIRICMPINGLLTYCATFFVVLASEQYKARFASIEGHSARNFSATFAASARSSFDLHISNQSMYFTLMKTDTHLEASRFLNSRSLPFSRLWSAMQSARVLGMSRNASMLRKIHFDSVPRGSCILSFLHGIKFYSTTHAM